MQFNIEKWYTKIRSYIFKYKKGFFELPFISNSPQLMWESFKSMPFCKYDALKNSITANNPFVEAEVYYHEPQDGLVIVYSSVFFKRNIIYKQLFQKNIKTNYYNLSCFVNEVKQHSDKTFMHDVHFDGQMWVIMKPGAKLKNFHFKDSQSTCINLHFTQKWLNHYIKKNLENNEQLVQWIESKNELFTSQHKSSIIGNSLLHQTKTILSEYPVEERNKALESTITELIQFFKTECLLEIGNPNYFSLTNSDRINIKKAEQILHEHLYKQFPGITYLAHEVSLSETKIKSLFKLIHQTTILNYFHQLKMAAAKEMLDSKEQKIADVASHFGYENASKFSAAFKQQYEYLPSQTATQTNPKPQLK